MAARQKPPAKAPKAPAKTALVVLGMHRSGTSALAGVLTQLGCAAPATPITPNRENPKGFFESRKIVRLNETLLVLGHSAWHDWRALGVPDVSTKRAAAFRDRAKTLLEEEFGAAPMIVLKDPRICRLLPFWIDVLREAGRTPVFVHIIRDPLEVAGSLKVRNGFDPAYGLLSWLRHVLDAEAYARGAPRIFIDYADLLADWRKSVARLERGLKIKFPVRPAQAAAEIDAFLETDLNRSRTAAGPGDTPADLPDWVASAHGVLQVWTARAERKKDHATLDRVRAQLNGAEAMFLPVIRNMLWTQEERDRAETAAGIEKQRAITSSRQVQELTQELDVAHMQASNVQHDIGQLRAELEQNRSDLGAARSRIRTQAARISRLEDSLKTRDHDLGRLAAAQNDAGQRIDGLKSDIALLEAENTALLQSVSWRISAPVRLVGTLFRRLGLRRGTR